jgi:hypothetical protein
MKRCTIFVILIGFCLIFFLIARPETSGQQGVPKPPEPALPGVMPKERQGEKKPAEPATLEEMQKDRIDALEKLVGSLNAQYKVGTVTFDDFSKAEDDLIEAKLDATSQPDERIALLEKQLKLNQDLFDFVEKCYKAGFGKNPVTDYLRCKAHLLNIKIKLAREKARKNM